MKKHYIKHYIILVFLISFLFGKVFDLHAHGHIETPHSHSEISAAFDAAHHDHHHGDTDTHLVNWMTDLPNKLSHSNSEHGHKTFDIENDAVTKKQTKNSGIDSDIVFLFSFLLILFLFSCKSFNVRPARQFQFSFQQRLFAINHPLRAPPSQA